MFWKNNWQFFTVARSSLYPQRQLLTRSTYPKNLVFILRYLWSLWRVRCDLINISSRSSKKTQSLSLTESLLDSSGISFVISGDKSLLKEPPHSGCKIHYIQSSIRSIQTSIARGKRRASKNQLFLTLFLTK